MTSSIELWVFFRLLMIVGMIPTRATRIGAQAVRTAAHLSAVSIGTASSQQLATSVAHSRKAARHSGVRIPSIGPSQ